MPRPSNAQSVEVELFSYLFNTGTAFNEVTLIDEKGTQEDSTHVLAKAAFVQKTDAGTPVAYTYVAEFPLDSYPDDQQLGFKLTAENTWGDKLMAGNRYYDFYAASTTGYPEYLVANGRLVIDRTAPGLASLTLDGKDLTTGDWSGRPFSGGAVEVTVSDAGNHFDGNSSYIVFTDQIGNKYGIGVGYDTAWSGSKATMDLPDDVPLSWVPR